MARPGGGQRSKVRDVRRRRLSPGETRALGGSTDNLRQAEEVTHSIFSSLIFMVHNWVTLQADNGCIGNERVFQNLPNCFAKAEDFDFCTRRTLNRTV